MKHILVSIWLVSIIFSLLFVIENVFYKLDYWTLIPSVLILLVTFSILSFTRDENKR